MKEPKKPEKKIIPKEFDRLLPGIDDEIDRWHHSDTDMPLHAWLGLTEAEYKLFVEGNVVEIYEGLQ